MQTAHELYSGQVTSLSAAEQMRLATMILQGLSATAATAVDFYSDEWSEEDMRDAAIASLRHAAGTFGEE
jgi:hypothetical protein